MLCGIRKINVFHFVSKLTKFDLQWNSSKKRGTKRDSADPDSQDTTSSLPSPAPFLRASAWRSRQSRDRHVTVTWPSCDRHAVDVTVVTLLPRVFFCWQTNTRSTLNIYNISTKQIKTYETNFCFSFWFFSAQKVKMYLQLRSDAKLCSFWQCCQGQTIVTM
jgi:hypothetical protein